MNTPPLSPRDYREEDPLPTQYVGVDRSGRIYTINYDEDKENIHVIEVSNLPVRWPVKIILLNDNGRELNGNFF